MKNLKLFRVTGRVPYGSSTVPVERTFGAANLELAAAYARKEFGFVEITGVVAGGQVDGVDFADAETVADELSFDDLRAGNVARLPEFKNAKGGPACTRADGSDWTLLEWLGSVAGEVGEAANWAKKVRRGDVELDDAVEVKGVTMTVREAIAEELADVACYLDIAALQVGADLGEAIRKKFNSISDRVGSGVKL